MPAPPVEFTDLWALWERVPRPRTPRELEDSRRQWRTVLDLAGWTVCEWQCECVRRGLAGAALMTRR